MTKTAHTQEINAGERFDFGENWARFLELMNETHICEAENDLEKMLETQTMEGKRFLDAGCGSGSHSLAAYLSRPDLKAGDSSMQFRGARGSRNADLADPTMNSGDCARLVFKKPSAHGYCRKS
ncbi:MAG: hypothetical protein LBQ81_06525 [Zoogloeaceae bacterium]|jgi:ubiquinone/menaquinone biosynthesis C-methylase UbiE|nr:hypothetical protein [Zoogloeaceae bacterium]